MYVRYSVSTSMMMKALSSSKIQVKKLMSLSRLTLNRSKISCQFTFDCDMIDGGLGILTFIKPLSRLLSMILFPTC